MKIKIISGTPTVGVAGLGLMETNKWVTLTKKQEQDFERVHGKPVDEMFETKKEVKPKKEAS